MGPKSTINHDSSILIVGGGTWGCSTALHLARRGYKNVRVLDPYDIPSPISAGNDINKIIESGGTTTPPAPNEPLPTMLSRLASHGWAHDTAFKSYYHNTGYVLAAHTPAGIEQVIEDELASHDYTWLDTPCAFRATMPAGILTGNFPGWKGGHRKSGAGWVYARGALLSAYNEASGLGVQFITGAAGNVIKLEHDESNRITGLLTANGTHHPADIVILACGAAAPSLLDMKNQLRPTAWTLAHIQLTPSERELYRDLPVLFNIESGFFMEPDAERGELKICDEHPGYCNFVRDPVSREISGSIPFAKHQIPLESEKRVRAFLRATMPQLADRPLVFARLCWDADTTDRMFLIDWHLEINGLLLGLGASGHGFMHIPSVGGLVVDCLEGRLDARLRDGMRWRPEVAWGKEKEWDDVLDRRGADNKVMDLADVKGWTDIPERAGRQKL